MTQPNEKLGAEAGTGRGSVEADLISRMFGAERAIDHFRIIHRRRIGVLCGPIGSERPLRSFARMPRSARSRPADPASTVNPPPCRLSKTRARFSAGTCAGVNMCAPVLLRLRTPASVPHAARAGLPNWRCTVHTFLGASRGLPGPESLGRPWRTRCASALTVFGGGELGTPVTTNGIAFSTENTLSDQRRWP